MWLESRQLGEGEGWVKVERKRARRPSCENLGCEGSSWRGTGAEGVVSRWETPEPTGWRNQKEREVLALHSKEQSPLACDLGWKLGDVLAGERGERGSVDY